METKIIEIIENILYPKVKIKYLDNYNFKKFKEISYAKLGDCCFDLRACISDQIILKPKKQVLIGTGIKLELPNNDFFELQIRPRSGISNKKKIIILNSPGTVDSKYRGEIKVGLYNLGIDDFIINYGDRIAQAKVAFVPRPIFKTTNQLNKTNRGSSGFGDSGMK